MLKDQWLERKTTSPLDRKYCRDCKYYAGGNESTEYLCNYYLIKYERRGCKTGVGCTKKEIGNRVRLKDYIIMPSIKQLKGEKNDDL